MIMDDLDKELFSKALKKINKTSPHHTSQKSGLDFDEDDPLGDLLSSSGEHTPIKGVPKRLHSKESSDVSKQQSKAKHVIDVFGLNDQDEVKKDKTSTSTYERPIRKIEDPSDWLGLKAETDIDQNEHHDQKSEKYALPTPKSPHLLSKTNSKDEDFSLLFDTRDNTKDNVGTDFVSKKQSGQGFDEPAARVTVSGPRRRGGTIQEPKKTSTVLHSFISDFDSKPTVPSSVFKGDETDSGADLKKGSYTPSLIREPRRSSRRREGNLVDPLGLFSSSSEVFQPETKIAKDSHNPPAEPDFILTPLVKKTPSAISTPVTDQVPEWLGGSSSQPISTHPGASSQTAAGESESATEEEKPPQPSDVDILTGLANLEAQAGEAAAQQQKSLITALALKRQKDTLLKLQAQQATLLAQHEQQLGALVQRQIQRQQQMVKQQENIQAHIQALLVQPPPMPPIVLPSTFSNVEDGSWLNSETNVKKSATKIQNEEDLETILELKGQNLRLETENSDLREQLENERKRYESHLTDMETMYRRQLSAQEEGMIKQEKRFSSELEFMEKEVVSRVSRLKEEHNEASQQQTQRMAQLHGEWLADLQRLSEFHKQAIEMLRSEQTSAIEHWKNLQATEIAAVKEASSNARVLQTAVDHVKESTTILSEMRDQIRKQSSSLLSQKEESLLKQEVQLSGLQEALEKQAAALDTERSCLSAMSRDLEARMLRQQQEINDERNRFEARTKAWEKEKLSAVEMLDKQKRYVEKLQLEAQTELAGLEERKLALAADVARLETTLHIQSSSANRNSLHAEEMVAEARSTLEAAQEAGKEVQREREEIMTLKSSLNAEQKRLETAERELKILEKQIEEEKLRARAFRDEGISALEEARRLERERTEHASDLAQRLLQLKEREDRLSEEKLAVTFEWKRLQESREHVLCSHCGQLASMAISSSNNSRDIVDPMPIIMKLEAEQELDFATLDRPQYHSTFLESVSQ